MRLSEALGKHKPRRDTITLCMDGDVLARYKALEEERERYVALRDDNPSLAADGDVEATLEEIDGEIEALEGPLSEAMVDYEVVDVGHWRWEKIREQHPPTDDQDSGSKVFRLQYNPDTFPVHVLAASLVEPTHDAECNCHIDEQPCDVSDIQALQRKLSTGQWNALWGVCGTVNTASDGDGVGKEDGATGRMRRTVSKLTSAAAEGSPAASS